jgi:hypothetical protein
MRFRIVPEPPGQSGDRAWGENPGHVAAAWLGHSRIVAHEHYWQVTDADFKRATQQGGAAGDSGGGPQAAQTVTPTASASDATTSDK